MVFVDLDDQNIQNMAGGMPAATSGSRGPRAKRACQYRKQGKFNLRPARPIFRGKTAEGDASPTRPGRRS